MSSDSRLLRKLRKIMGVTVVLPSMFGCSLHVSNAEVTFSHRGKCLYFEGNGELTSKICNKASSYAFCTEQIIIGPEVVLANDIKFGDYFVHLKVVKIIQGLLGTSKIGNDGFSDCKKLITVYLPDNIEAIGDNAFKDCYELSNLNSSMSENVAGVGNYKIPESVVEIGNNAFEGCRNLKSITVPITVKKIGESAFRYCEGLETFNFSSPIDTINNSSIAANKKKMNKITPIVPSVDKTFNGPTVINEEEINKTSFINPSIDKSFIESTTKDFPSEVENVSGITEISENTFEGCINLERIIIPPTVKKIGVYAFRSCEKLSKVEIPDSVETIKDGAFEECRSLKFFHIKNPKCKFTKSAFYRSPTVVKLGDQILSFN